MTPPAFVEGRTPYEVEDQWIVSAKMPLGHEMMLAVDVNPEDPTEVAIDWAPLPLHVRIPYRMMFWAAAATLSERVLGIRGLCKPVGARRLGRLLIGLLRWALGSSPS